MTCPKCRAPASCLYRASDIYGDYVSCRCCGWQVTVTAYEPDAHEHKRRVSTYNRKTLVPKVT